VIRDGLKGSVFQTTSKGYISGEAKATASRVRFGISGGNLSGFGWKVPDNMVINYMSAHDNHSLWDKLALSNPDDSPEVRAEMNRLGAAVLMISRGTPFFQAGEEMLRSKDGDENSYKSSDGVNNIRWDTLLPDSEAYRTMEYYRGLIAMRQAYDIFRGGEEVTFLDLGEGRMEIRFGESALAIVNPTDIPFTHTLSGSWNLVADETAAGSDSIRVEAGEIQLAPRSIRIYVK
jgi:pullulanase